MNLYLDNETGCDSYEGARKLESHVNKTKQEQNFRKIKDPETRKVKFLSEDHFICFILAVGLFEAKF